MAEEYDEAGYDETIMANYITEEDYRYIIGGLNVTLTQFWPCDLVIYIGYILAPFCFGLSLLLPNLCIADAKKALMGTIEKTNKIKLAQKGLKLTYHQSCSTSWLELTVTKPILEKITVDLELAPISSKIGVQEGVKSKPSAEVAYLSGSTSCG